MDTMIHGPAVLFSVILKSHVFETLPIAKKLLQGGQYTPFYLLDPKTADDLLPIIAAENIAALHPRGTQYEAKKGGQQRSPEYLDSPPSFKKRTFAKLPEFVRSFLLLRGRLQRARALLKKRPDIKAIVLVGDRHIGFETGLIRAANELGVPTLIVPFAMSFQASVAEPRLRDPHFPQTFGVTTVWRRIIAWLFPAWVFVWKGTRIFYRSPSESLAAWLLHIMPRRPWILGSGSCTRMVVESAHAFESFVAQGVPAEKMRVTGKPSLDTISTARESHDHNALRASLGIAPGQKIILCSVPQLAEHDLVSWEQQHADMQWLFETLGASGANVLLSLHPKSDPAIYRSLAKEAGAVIATQRIYELLPLCDVFVATYSSTVAQAIALHKPIVVIDFWNLLYPVFDDAPGVTVLRDRDGLLPLFQKLLTDKDFVQKQRAAQRIHGHEWAMLDGKCTERVVAELSELIEGTPGVFVQ